MMILRHKRVTNCLIATIHRLICNQLFNPILLILSYLHGSYSAMETTCELLGNRNSPKVFESVTCHSVDIQTCDMASFLHVSGLVIYNQVGPTCIIVYACGITLNGHTMTCSSTTAVQGTLGIKIHLS